MGRRPLAEHAARPWCVHELVADFTCDEVWEYPITLSGQPGDDFAAFRAWMADQDPNPGGAAGALFRLRAWLGQVFGWDGSARPIPGCEESTLRARLPDELRLPEEAVQADPMGFVPVYVQPDEQLVELGNQTVHAALHVSAVRREDGSQVPALAVYWKARGLFGRLYMAAITPFRIWAVYPALMRMVAAKWSRREA